MKVIIADDEIKICQLIEYLVDWEAMNMEIAAVVNNGVDALEAIRVHQPDIVITDIRMPGISGLEMIRQAKEISPQMQVIIISGHRHFEYAQTAIKFGVKDYLLKPIKKQELIETLVRMRQAYMEKTQQLSNEEKLRLFEQNDIERQRSEFFKDIIFEKQISKDQLTIDNVNREYHFVFKEGIFQIAMIKIDGIHEAAVRNMEFIEEKIRQLIESNLTEICYDLEYMVEKESSYLILNYSAERKSVRKSLKALIDELTLQKDIFADMEVTIGLGEPCMAIKHLDHSFSTAGWAIEQRLITGTNKVIEGMKVSANSLVDSKLFAEFNNRFNIALECQNIPEIKNAVLFLGQELHRRPETTGHEVIQMAKEAMNLYMFEMHRNQFPPEELDRLFAEFNEGVHNYGSVDGVLQYLIRTISTSFEQMLELKKQADTKPIREAKQYILEHYMEPISLEIVSDAVGFNTTYFSSLFKKETGKTFSEYLLKTRMNQAKSLLKETKMSVADICEKVGYSDIKHFTKNFTKYTSLKPGEYRKLYS